MQSKLNATFIAIPLQIISLCVQNRFRRNVRIIILTTIVIIIIKIKVKTIIYNVNDICKKKKKTVIFSFVWDISRTYTTSMTVHIK
jgi:hypothetical protein